MEAKDITPQSLLTALIECSDQVVPSDQADHRLYMMADVLLQSQECEKLVMELYAKMGPLVRVSPSFFFRMVLMMGIVVGMTIKTRDEELKLLDSVVKP